MLRRKLYRRTPPPNVRRRGPRRRRARRSRFTNGRSNPELKYYDSATTPTNVGSSLLTFASGSAHHEFVNTIAGGSGVSQREGNKATMRRFASTGILSISSGHLPTFVRVMLVRDAFPNGNTKPVPTDILKNIFQRNLEKTNRFRTIAEAEFLAPPNEAPAGTALVPPRCYKVKLFKSLKNMETAYNSATADDFAKNSLALVMATNQGTASYSGNHRLRFQF